ncbi:MAG: hypothetical protein GY941_15905 [Planctomycetes bacterium]|nr:hypothetical protein [Planctomycetota bacterium]
MIKPTLIIFLILSNAITQASAESSIRFGYMPRFINYSVNDPDGSTDTASEIQALGGMIAYKLGRGSRIFSYMSIYDFDIDYGFNKIGQTVESTSFGIYYQSEFKFSRTFKPWLGLGGAINIDEFTNRADTDSDGFLLNTYPDRDGVYTSLGFLASQEWSISDSLSLGINFEYLIPISETFEGFSINFSLIYD